MPSSCETPTHPSRLGGPPFEENVLRESIGSSGKTCLWIVCVYALCKDNSHALLVSNLSDVGTDSQSYRIWLIVRASIRTVHKCKRLSKRYDTEYCEVGSVVRIDLFWNHSVAASRVRIKPVPCLPDGVHKQGFKAVRGRMAP